MNICSFCKKEQKRYLSKGYCVSCYQYFILYGYKVFPKSSYGSLDYVTNEKDIQYGMCICHECGKAYNKLQQHIFYNHKMSKFQYCDKWGLDHNVRLTSDGYNLKMSQYAYKNKMGEQLKRVGEKTRFKKGAKNGNYKRSYQTKERLKKFGEVIKKKYDK